MNIELVTRVVVPINIGLWSRIIIFSDSHMGDGTNSDRFNSSEFSWLLRNYIKNFDLLVGAGDIFDVWSSGYKVFNAHKDIIQSMLFNDNHSFYYVCGNHDMEMIQFKGLFELGVRNQAKISNEILVVHGNGADVWNSSLSPVGAVATKIRDWFDKIFREKHTDVTALSQIENKYKIKPSIMSDVEFSKYKNLYIEYMVKLLKENSGTRFGVYGHTHRIDVEKVDNYYIINTGDFVGNNSFIEFDTHGFSIYRVK